MAYHNMELVRDIIWEREEKTDYGKIYFSSNEELNQLFQYFDVEGKEVLTVLGSSDQLFFSIDRGSTKIDTFDRNPYTKYYYYLRRWNILYNNSYYITEDLFKKHFPIIDIICRVRPQSEEEADAYCFWKKYIKTIFPFENEGLFYHNNIRNYVNDIDTLKEKLEIIHPTFYNIDIYEEVNIPKKYDVIITSNMFEYVRTREDKIIVGRDNLKKLLKDDGKIIATHIVFNGDDRFFDEEVDIYSSDFIYEEFPWVDKPLYHNKYPLGYSYTKKR